ncbi:MAG: calcium/sodium antiporter [Neomegalonema sp.]|nr:calcium/sodium antiporter [Neomegalonema sp.]
MFQNFLEIAVGLMLLLAAGDLLVKGAVAAGLRLGIPAIVVGLTIVAFGTSAPELMVSIKAALEGAPGIAVGNVVGSNIANVLLVLGLPALLAPLGDHSVETRRNYLIMMLATVVVIGLFFSAPLSLWQGMLMLALLGAFLYDTYRHAMKSRAMGEAAACLEELEDADPTMPWWKIGGLILLGLIGLPLGADLAVDGAREIALRYGVSEEAIGLTLIALGTSLPELATTLMAAIRGRADIAIGNVIGSNVFNILCILGVTAIMSKVDIAPEFLSLNIWVMLAASAALAPFVLMRKDVGRVAGGLFVASYVAYIVVVLMPSGGPA